MNNPTEGEKEIIRLWEVNRCAITSEVGETGTPHLQGFVTWTRAMRLSAVRKLAPRAHWEISKTADWNYELKTDSTPFRIENNTKQGHRSDHDSVYEAVERKVTLRDYVATSRPTLGQIKLFEKVQSLHHPRPIAPIEVHWYYGPTGTGKTRSAYEQWPDLFSAFDFKWWDGYTGQETVLIDDFRRDWCKFHDLLRLLDIYPYTLQVKGGTVQLQATRIVITSPYPPSETYETREDIDQLLRRITNIQEFVPSPPPPP